MNCPECTGLLIKNKNDGQGVLTCPFCFHSWFILCTSTERKNEAGTESKKVDRNRTWSITTAKLPVSIVIVLEESGLCESRSKSRNLIKGGGVRIGDTKITSIDDMISAEHHNHALWAGKKNFVILRVEE